MTLGEKIQSLRKSNNKTQDELAEILGVSRQALSKWENGTSNPEIDKIVLISNYFSVTTDYILKNECEESATVLDSDNASKTQKGRKIPLILSTIIISIGFIVAVAFANDGTLFFYWQFRDAALGIAIQIVGVGIYEVMYFSEKYERDRQHLFWIINIWILSIMPAIFCAGLVTRILLNSFEIFMLLKYTGIGYVFFNSIVSVILLVLFKKNKSIIFP
ncbi:putative transcriptional regulator [Desulfosporosinus orientis DSM 765]|uniref:Putative transcriptional regulator n=1 Tax=Desulfosporosinus orientis (strain ATCC 19365 / DSM 765 / NCIMB 8382 / VKM B-1628 / Singapore I) TaxID=768706 RepID=G7W9G6_DESOD|nr:helix-turn-helix transcriptional regulator [Desulfosporosinus orientis]AET69303.1 putative transcriptional regulator [Desulfosporosinus orientis DSM 765]